MKRDHSKPHRSFQTFLIIAGIPFLAFGVFSFVVIYRWQIEWEQKVDAIRSHQVHAIQAKIVAIEVRHERSGHKSASDNHYLIFQAPDSPEKIERHVDRDTWRNMRIGSTTPVYRFGDEYFVPLADTGGHDWGKWIFLLFGATPLIGAGFIQLIRSIAVRMKNRRVH